MKKCLSILLAFCLLLTLFCGCEKAEKQEKVELKADGCLSPFQWGMTVAEAGAVIEKNEALKELSRSENNIKVETKLMEVAVEVDLRFDTPAVTLAAGDVLTAVYVTFQGWDRATCIEKISGVLGEQESRQLVYSRVGDEETIETDNELAEAGRYWHSPQNLLDVLSEEKIIEIYGATEAELAEKSLLERFYQSFLYTATLYDDSPLPGSRAEPDELKHMLVIDGGYQVIADLARAK